MLEQGIYELATGGTQPALELQAIIGTRFYPVVLPEDPAYPCAVYLVVSDVPEYDLQGKVAMRAMRLQIDTWSGGLETAKWSDAKAAQAAFRCLLEGFRGKLPSGDVVAGIFVATAQDLYEPDARAYRTITDYLIHFYPTAA